MKGKKEDKRIRSIIEEAAIDSHDDDEEYNGWESVLSDKITVPQKCNVNGEGAVLTGIVCGIRGD